MEIEKSSKFIRTIYDEEDIDFDTLDYNNEIKTLFNMFSNGKKLSIDFDKVVVYLDKFNKINKIETFSTFNPPLVQEYFCKQLNFLLIIDFILTFFKIDNIQFSATNLTTQFIFEFFISLSDFFDFMNYLDVSESFLNYLKFMITLYSLQLDRKIIEQKLPNFVYILDDFFQNVIMPKVFKEVGYKKFDSLTGEIEFYNNLFSKEIKDYDPTISYQSETYKFLDDLFYNIHIYSRSQIEIRVKTKTIEIPNPEPLTPMHTVYNENDDDDNDDDDDYDDDDNDWEGPRWTPTIKKQVPLIEQEDPNFEEYRKLFILRNYQEIKKPYDNVINEIKSICSSIQLNKYNALETTDTCIEMMKVKTILGCILDYTIIPKKVCQDIFGLACEYGHLEIVKKIVEAKKGDIGESNFVNAYTSPNRAIRCYLEEKKTSMKKLRELFNEFKNDNYYEPKISFK